MAFREKIGKYYYVRYKDESGKWKRKSCGRKATRMDADYLVKEYSARELNYHHKKPVRMVETDLIKGIEKFQKEELPRWKIGIEKQESSIRREQSALDNVIEYLQDHGMKKFKSFDRMVAQEYLDYRRDKGMSPRTVKEERRLLNNFFIWAMEMHFCSENPMVKSVAPKSIKKKPRYFSFKELALIFSLAKEPYRTIFRFLFLTGLRIGELSNLIWTDWDSENQILKIRVVAANKKKRTPGNKTKREEFIPLNEDAIAVLESRRAADDSEIFIFLNAEGNRLEDDNVYRNLKRILDNESIMDASPHTFRHSFASHLAIQGVSLYVIRDLLMHKSIKETEIYAHLSPDSKREAVKKLSLPRVIAEAA